MDFKIKGTSKRNLLWYFMRSKIWKEYEQKYTLNYDWQLEFGDPNRAAMMLNAKSTATKGKPALKGLQVCDYIYDMMDCVQNSKLKSATKVRLYCELSDLETYHEGMETWDHIL